MTEPKPEPPSLPEVLRIIAEEWQIFTELVLTPEQKKKLAAIRSRRTPESEEALALHAMFGRRAKTLWSLTEIKAFLAAQATGLVTLENIELVSWFRQVELPKGEKGFCRRSLESLLNNLGAEIEKAKSCPEYRRREKATAKPRVIIPLEQPTSDQDRARLAEEASRLAKELRGA